MQLRDRLTPSSYADDEVVGIAAVPRTELPGPLGDERWTYVPERLWRRVLNLSNAYELHIGHVLEPVIDTVLAKEQCESAAGELRFLRDIVADPALHYVLDVILRALDSSIRGSDVAVVFSPP
jgi:hypothetical protein